MANYYCLIAGLPDVSFDGGKVGFSIDRFREEVCPHLDACDERCINLFFLAWDNVNILRILRFGNEVNLNRQGCFTKEQLCDLIAAAKEGDVRCTDIPDYLYEFLEYYFSNEENSGIIWEDVINSHYYAYAMSCSNKFISAWFTFNLNLNNVLVAQLARKYKMNVSECVLGNNEIAETIRSSAARDFGLTGIFDGLEDVMRISENDKLQEREHLIDELRWKWLDDNSVFNYFTLERLFVFLQKLDIVERWTALDSEKGMQRYKELIDDLKGGMASVDNV